MLDRILSWIAEEIAGLRKQNQPTTLYRPVSADVKTKWTYTATHTGMLYLAFNSFQRTYIGIEWKNAVIGDFAIPTGSGASAFVIPIAVKKGDTIKVNNLNSNCYLTTRTALIAWGGVLLSPYFSTLSAILNKIGGGVDVRQNSSFYSEQNSHHTKQHQKFNCCENYEYKGVSWSKHNLHVNSDWPIISNPKRVQANSGILCGNWGEYSHLLSMQIRHWQCWSFAVAQLDKFRTNNISIAHGNQHKRFITNDWGCLVC